MIKKICLILAADESAIFGTNGMKLPPLSLGIITAHLRRHGFEVDPFDLNRVMGKEYGKEDIPALEQFFDKDLVFDHMKGVRNDFFHDYADRLLKGIDIEKYDLIAFSIGSSMSWLQIHSALIMGRFLRQKCGKIQVIGGVNMGCLSMYSRHSPVYDPIMQLFLENFHYVVKGPGEEVLLQLIRALNRGKSDDEIRNIKGVGRLTGEGKFRFNLPERRRIICPDFDGLAQHYYNYANKKNPGETVNALYSHPFLFTAKLQSPPRHIKEHCEPKLVIPYVFNYGCPYNCAFCTESGAGPDTIVIGKVEQVADHLETLTKKYDTPYFYFINNAVNCSKKYVNHLCDEILKRKLNIYWSDCARFNNVDPDTLVKMEKAGCRKLVFGMETASQKVLNRINKDLDLDFTRQVFEWCRQVGILVELEIIVGLPTETEESFEESYRFLKKNVKYLNALTINRYIPFPQSTMFDFPERFGINLVQTYSYEDNLKRDLELFRKKEVTGLHSNLMKVFQYNEIDGRSCRQVEQDTEKSHAKMHGLLGTILKRRVMMHIKKGYLTWLDLSAL